MRRPSFLLQFLIALAVLILAAQTVLLLVFTQQIRHDLQEENITNMRSTAQLLKEWARSDLSALFAGQDREILSRISNRGGYWVSLFDVQGKLLQDTHLTPGIFQDNRTATELDDARISREGQAQRYSPVMDREMLFFALPFFDDGKIVGFIRVATPVDGLNRTIGGLFVFFFTISFLSLGIIFVAAYYYSRAFSRNIHKLILNSGAYAQGLPYEKVFLEKPKELRLLSLAMNKMFDQLDERIDTISRQKNELQAILSGMVEAVIVLDLHFRIRNLNPAAKRLFPCDRPCEELSLIELCRNSELDEFTQKLVNDQVQQARAEILMRDLETTLQVQGASLVDENGKRWGAVLVMSDITQLKRLEMMRRDFVANVSHELKTPITNIKGFVETLQAGAYKSPEKAEQFLEIIERHAERLRLIVDDLLILTRIENSPPQEGERAIVDLQEIVMSAAQVCQKKIQSKGITLDFDFSGKELRTAAYPILIEQAIVNLLDNAVKFSAEKGLITIHLKREGSNFLLGVEDQGVGIPEKEQERIFERFYRTEKGRSTEGTGLGLSIVKHVLLVHRGTVSVTSPVPEQNRGTLFTLTIPATEIDV